MTVLLALALIVHGGIHIAYPCGPAWPFDTGDPWPVTTLGVAAGTVRDGGVVLAVVAFLAFLVAAVAAIGLLPSRVWRPAVLVGVAASAVMLVAFVTPATLAGLAIDAVIAWAVVVRGWRPNPLIGRHKAIPEARDLTADGWAR